MADEVSEIANSKLRRRIAGQLNHGPRGLVILTDAGDRWVIVNEEVEPDLIGRQVVAEGVAIGLDRLKVDWIGEEGGPA